MPLRAVRPHRLLRQLPVAARVRTRPDIRSSAASSPGSPGSGTTKADRERRQRRPPADDECTADRRHHDPLDPNDEGSTADQVPPGTGSRPAAAHEMPGTCRSTMTPPGIGATRAEVTGMVLSTLLKWWCPYTLLSGHQQAD